MTITYKSRNHDKNMDFVDSWKKRCLTENAISEAVYAANIEVLDERGVYESLNWQIPRQRGFRRTPWNQAVGFADERGHIWQAKLDVPHVSNEGKVRKYESPKGGGAMVYRPHVPTEARQAITARFGIEVPLDGNFWDWFTKSHAAKAIPLAVTEGGTKCLSLISAGFPAVSLYGCTSAWQKRDSKYDPKQLLGELRSVIRSHELWIMFDQDDKLATRRNVRRAIVGLGNKIKLICRPLKIVEWPAAKGKGIDDFIAANGVTALEGAIEAAQEFTQWKRDSSRKWAQAASAELAARADADIEKTADTIHDCRFPIPELGEAILFDGPMGNGKTFHMGKVIGRLEFDYPNLVVDACGHRNNLLRQTGRRLHLEHIAEMVQFGRDSQVEYADRLAYCIDSLPRRFDKLIRAMDQGRKVLLLLDELDAIIKHLLLATTIKAHKRIELICKFSILIKKIAQGGGWIIGGEAHLSALSVQALKDLSDGQLKITVCRNNKQPHPWECHIVDVFGKLSIAGTMKEAAMNLTSKFLGEGKRVLLLTTSQAAAEAMDEIYHEQGYTTLRIDGKTSSEDWAHQLMQSPAHEIRNSNAQLVIGTPAIESGLSIEGTDLFDAVVLYSSGLEPATSYQMLGRLRDPSVPRYLCIADQSVAASQEKVNPNDILANWRDRAVDVMERYGIDPKENDTLTIAHKLAADYKGREAAGKLMLRASVIDRLKEEGHSIKSHCIDLTGEERDKLREASEVVKEQRIADWLAADDSGLTLEQAEINLKSDLSWLEFVRNYKAVYRGKFGDIVDNRDWVETYWGDERKAKILLNALRTATELANPGMAEEADRRYLLHQIKATGSAWFGDFKSRAAAIRTLNKIGVHELATVKFLHGDSYVVQNVFRLALRFADEVKESLDLTVTPDTKPMAFVNLILRNRLALNLKAAHRRNIVEGKTRTYCYEIEPCPYRDEMMASIKKGHEEYEEKTTEFVLPVEVQALVVPPDDPVSKPLFQDTERPTVQPIDARAEASPTTPDPSNPAHWIRNAWDELVDVFTGYRLHPNPNVCFDSFCY